MARRPLIPAEEGQIMDAAALGHPEIRTMEIRSLKPAKYNPRRIDQAAIAGLERSMERFGLVEPIVVNHRTSTVIGGHQRLKILKKRGIKSTSVVVVDLPDAEEKALNLALNNPATSGSFNGALGALLEEIRASDEQLFRELRLDALVGTTEPPPERDIEAVPEAPEHPRTQRGDLYILGRHRLLCGDSTSPQSYKTLLNGERCSVVWTDPPYNVAYESKGKKHQAIANDDMASADFLRFLTASFSLVHDNIVPGAPIYIAHADTESLNFLTAFRDAGFRLGSRLIWLKNAPVLGHSDYQWQHEPILYGWRSDGSHPWFGDRKQRTVLDLGSEPYRFISENMIQIRTSNDDVVTIEGKSLSLEIAPGTVIRHNSPKANTEHPTMKPVELIKRMLTNSASPGELLLDPFCGSGSTLMAAEQMSLKARAIELEPKYCDVIVDRWEAFTGKKGELVRGST